MLYKVTYDHVQFPHPSTSPSRHIHPLSYRQIPTLKDYYWFTFSQKSIIHWNALPAQIPILPTLAQFSSAACQVTHFSMGCRLTINLLLLISLNRFSDITKSNLLYRIIFCDITNYNVISQSYKIEIVMSQNRFCDITK